MHETQPIVLLLTIELLIPHAQSLKEKRSVVRGLKDRLRARFNASVAEVGYADKWQRAVLGVTMVGGDRKRLETEAARLEKVCEEALDLQISCVQREWM